MCHGFGNVIEWNCARWNCDQLTYYLCTDTLLTGRSTSNVQWLQIVDFSNDICFSWSYNSSSYNELYEIFIILCTHYWRTQFDFITTCSFIRLKISQLIWKFWAESFSCPFSGFVFAIKISIIAHFLLFPNGGAFNLTIKIFKAFMCIVSENRSTKTTNFLWANMASYFFSREGGREVRYYPFQTHLLASWLTRCFIYALWKLKFWQFLKFFNLFLLLSFFFSVASIKELWPA